MIALILTFIFSLFLGIFVGLEGELLTTFTIVATILISILNLIV